MRTTIVPDVRADFYSVPDNNMLNIVYPQLYCPRCGSYEIGLRRFNDNQAIWGCRDCSAQFALDFSGQKRF